jgi:hypothetical protein
MGREEVPARSLDTCCEGKSCHPRWSEKPDFETPPRMEGMPENWATWYTVRLPIWPRVFPGL